MTLFSHDSLNGLVLKIRISQCESKCQCCFCREAPATQKVETFLCDVLVDVYCVCESCLTNAIVPAFKVQSAKIEFAAPVVEEREVKA